MTRRAAFHPGFVPLRRFFQVCEKMLVGESLASRGDNGFDELPNAKEFATGFKIPGYKRANRRAIGSSRRSRLTESDLLRIFHRRRQSYDSPRSCRRRYELIPAVREASFLIRLKAEPAGPDKP